VLRDRAVLLIAFVDGVAIKLFLGLFSWLYSVLLQIYFYFLLGYLEIEFRVSDSIGDWCWRQVCGMHCLCSYIGLQAFTCGIIELFSCD